MTAHLLMRASILATLAASVGCITPKTADDESDDTGSSGGNGGGGNGGGGSAASIYDVQMGEIDEGAIVTLKDVVVTSPLTSEGEGFFVQDEGGGEYTGIYIYTYDEVGADPAIGDVMTITGKIKEFYGFTEIEVTSADDVATTGSADPVATELTAEPANWEAYESVLVTLPNQTVTNASDLTSYGQVSLSIGVEMDNLFFNFEAETGGTYGSVTGPVHYSFEEYKLCPRTEADLQDYNDPIAVEPTNNTIYDIQSGVVADGSTVTITDVVATSGLDYNESGFFVQDEGGGAWSGLYIYVENDAVNAAQSIVPGSVVTISGQTTEFYELTELKVTSGDDIVIGGTTTEPVADVISDTPEDWEMYEGCLVTVSNVGVDGETDEYGATPLDNGLWLDDELNRDLDISAVSSSLFEITGPVTYSYEHFRILPRSDDDISVMP